MWRKIRSGISITCGLLGGIIIIRGSYLFWQDFPNPNEFLLPFLGCGFGLIVIAAVSSPEP